jgi:signal transduction histidine kinase
MAKLVNDLLELARADAGFSIDKEPMNLLEVVEAVRDELQTGHRPATIEVACGEAARRGRGRSPAGSSRSS